MSVRQPSVSVVIPTLNEESNIGGLIAQLRDQGADEIIISDGGSHDRTPEIAFESAVYVNGTANRGIQMNEGARIATGDVLLFLHADVRLGPSGLECVRRAMQDSNIRGGDFDIRYLGGDATARVFTAINRWRRRCGIFYGDSGIFCRRSVFEELGGYRPHPVLEDYEFARRLWRGGGLALLNEPIYVSDRRWREAGVLLTVWNWFWIQGLYLAGVSPERLAKLYRAIR